MPIRILMADDHAVFRSGLKALLEREPDLEMVAETGDGFATIEALESEDIIERYTGLRVLAAKDSKRIVAHAEALLAIPLADALCEKLGGDSLEEMRERYQQVRSGGLDEFDLRAAPWRFDYDL